MPSSRPSFSKTQVGGELKQRRVARQALQAFTEYTTPNWKAGKIHRAIAEQFDRVTRGEIDRLMLLCPPQHGKSSIASKRYPAFALGIDPAQDVIATSATSSLAEEFGRDVRNCIGSLEYQTLFPGVTLAEDSKAKGRWHTGQGGGYYAVGVGGAVMGRGADLGLIDDPFSTWEDAQSQLSRDKVWDWYTGTFYNRLRPGAPIIVIQHRMHEDDLAGRLLAKQATGDKWEVVEFPALLDDPPWPERYGRPALERIRDNSDPRKWSALYQQNPTPEEGTFFQRKWFDWYDPQRPPPVRKYATSDFAVTDDGGDWTSIGTHGVDPNDDLYLALGYWTGRTTADVWIEEVCNQILRHKPLAFFGEGGTIRRSVEPFLTKRMRERKAYCRVEWIPSIHDKPSRARALQARASMGKVKLPDDETGHKLLSQLLAFPGGLHDDDVDMLGLMGRVIDEAHPATLGGGEPQRKPDRYDRLFAQNEEQTWRT